MLLLLTFLFALITAEPGNDLTCDVPTVWYSKFELDRLLTVPTFYDGTVNYNATVYVNVNPVAEAPPIWQLVATLTGISVQQYNRKLGTLNGTFYIQVGPYLVPTSAWIFRMLQDNKLRDYNGYCLTGDNTTGYISGSIQADNFFSDAFVINKNYGPGPGALKLGDLFQFESFWFATQTQSQYSLRIYSTTQPTPVQMLDFYFLKVPSSKRRDAGPQVSDQMYTGLVTTVGRFKIPQSLIPQSMRQYFTFTQQ